VTADPRHSRKDVSECEGGSDLSRGYDQARDTSRIPGSNSHP